MVLQGNPTPLTPGRTPVPGRQVTSLTTTIVTHVQFLFNTLEDNNKNSDIQKDTSL